ncbi:40S ribosomal protein S18 [Thelohanellus kitauei]|uniref:Small ribosomal subunit protein uS13 n=1 Tax=Thelohanellus kitauei TaxID=669202 RepID=A0A0C2IN16_THEKT|nr:40S ribosomal protein S18 [Thelohanellus kitauei]
MPLILKKDFQYVLRVYNTNLDGNQKILYSIRKIKGIGPRIGDLILKKAKIDKNRRGGELSQKEIDKIQDMIANPAQYHIPDWMMNRRNDPRDGTNSILVSNGLDSKLRDDIVRLKKIKAHRGLRHYWGLRVRGQHTKSTGRRGNAVGVVKKKN